MEVEVVAVGVVVEMEVVAVVVAAGVVEVEEVVVEVTEVTAALEMAQDVDGAVDMVGEAEEDGDGEGTQECGVPEIAVVVGFPVVIKRQRKVKTNQTC